MRQRMLSLEWLQSRSQQGLWTWIQIHELTHRKTCLWSSTMLWWEECTVGCPLRLWEAATWLWSCKSLPCPQRFRVIYDLCITTLAAQHNSSMTKFGLLALVGKGRNRMGYAQARTASYKDTDNAEQARTGSSKVMTTQVQWVTREIDFLALHPENCWLTLAICDIFKAQDLYPCYFSLHLWEICKLKSSCMWPLPLH